MRMSELQTKNIVNIIDGKNIGNIIDITVDREGKVEDVILEANRSFFSIGVKENEKKIKWKDITKIGEDVILVNTSLK